MNRIFKPWFLIFAMILCSAFAGQAQATHARFGHFSWEPRLDISPTTVDFRLEVAFRRSYFGNLQLGSTFSPASFSFGDGSSASYQFEVIALNVQEDWVIGRAFEPGGDPGVVRHTYPTPTKSNGDPWLASMSVCCRISSLRNSAGTNFQVSTGIDLSDGNSSPVSSLPPIVSCPRGNCSFSIPVLDRDGDRIRWSLTPLSESGIRQNPTGLALDPDTGFVDWVDGSANAALGLYAVSATVEDLDEDGETRSSVVTDFIINLQDFVDNQPPAFDQPPSPDMDAVITAIVGQELVIDLQASDSDVNDQVFLNNLGLPSGATFETLSEGNPSTARFTWSPQIEDIGEYLVTFTATDQKAASALPLPVTIEVVKPAISDVRIIDRLSAVDIDVDYSSFSVDPTSVQVVDGQSILEWRYPIFEVGQVENLDFDLQLQNLLPGETRLVIHDLEMTYKDVNGNPVRSELGSRAITVAETVLALSTATDKIQYKPNETVVILSQMQNLDDISALATVDLSIVDAQGELVQPLGSFEAELAGGASRELSSKDFTVGNTLAGAYRVLAELRNSAGKLVATAEAPFSVVTESGGDFSLVSAVTADKPVYGGWDSVELLARLQNTSANALIGATDNEIVVVAPDGTELLRETRSLSSLAANAVQDFNFYLTLDDVSAGTYQMQWLTRDTDTGELLAQSQASFAVERALVQSIAGSVSVEQAQVFHTAGNACNYRIDNRSREATGEIEYAYSLIHLDSEELVQRQNLTADLADSAHKEWQQPVDAGELKCGGYGCILEAKLDDRWQVVGSAGFEVQDPKIVSQLSLGSRGRLLILADAPRQCLAPNGAGLSKGWPEHPHCDLGDSPGWAHGDGFPAGYNRGKKGGGSYIADPGPIAGGPDIEQQVAFLETVLQSEGWEYTLVRTTEAFIREHRTGGYSVYAILSGHPMLPKLVQQEMREAVFSGTGLLLAGAFDKRNGWLEPALGVRVVGRHSRAQGLHMYNSELGPEWSAPLPVRDWVLGVHLKAARQIGEYQRSSAKPPHQWLSLDQEFAGHTDYFEFKNPAVTLHNYGKGRSIFAGFDLMMQATVAGGDSVYADLLRNALVQVHPEQLPLVQTAAVPLSVHLDNERGATIGRATLVLPPGAQMLVPGPFYFDNGLWHWDFAAAEQGEVASRVYVRLPDKGSQAQFELQVATDIDNQYLQQQGQALNLGMESLPQMDSTLEQLDQLTSRYWLRLEYRLAYHKFKLARDAMSEGKWRAAQTWLATTAGLLMFGTEADVQAARLSVDEHIRQVGLQLNNQEQQGGTASLPQKKFGLF